MSKNTKNPVTDAPGYEVGYGKPPEATRFTKGKSGNPSGRPKRKKVMSADDMAMYEAHRLISVRDGDKIIKMPAYQAVLRSQLALAAKGNGPAQRAIERRVAEIERERFNVKMATLESVMTYKAEATKEIKRRKKLGITDISDISPHPDKIVIFPASGTFFINDPAALPYQLAYMNALP
jgi:hypothetical protein